MFGQTSGQRGMGWARAMGLMLAAWTLSSVSSTLLIAVPLSLLTVFSPPRRRLVVLGALLIAFLVVAGVPSTGLWYVERGWAVILGGWFLAVTLRWPSGAFVSRGLVAVGGAFAAMGLLFWRRPGQWAVVDWAMTSRIREMSGLSLQAARGILGPEVISVEMEARMLEVFSLQGMIFPALLGLASLAALGTAWWLYLRLSRATEIGIGPLVDFRFNDQLVWVLICGFFLVIGTSGVLERLGTNTIVFMGALYALRGVAVLLVVLGGPTVMLSLVFAILFVIAAPLFLTGAFVFGLGDTWLNLRVRLGHEPQGPGPSRSS